MAIYLQNQELSQYLRIISANDCTGCGSCAAICPRSCIAMEEDGRGFRMPMINRSRCIHCGLCEKACPVLNAVDLAAEISPIEVLAAKNRLDNVVANSSSGGVFSVLAEDVIANGGTVYGVVLNQNLIAEHIRIETCGRIAELRGSKYLQSNAVKAYPLVKTDLNEGKTVLFSGTPCQIAALRQFLRKEYSNLICVEVVCHGVPSQLAFKRYVDFIQDKRHSRVISVNFRDKSKGWHDNRVTYFFENGTKFSQRAADNLFNLGYINNLFVRESCTDCKFKGLKSGADITLGDMWGIENMLPSYDTAGGVSMVCINTSKGQEVFALVAGQVKDCVAVPYSGVKTHNACIWHSVSANPKRDYVLDNISNIPFNVLIKDVLNINLLTTSRKTFLRFKSYIISCLVSIKHCMIK